MTCVQFPSHVNLTGSVRDDADKVIEFNSEQQQEQDKKLKWKLERKQIRRWREEQLKEQEQRMDAARQKSREEYHREILIYLRKFNEWHAEWLELDFGFQDKLLQSGAMTRQECEDINEHYTLSTKKRNAVTVNHCIERHKTKELVCALHESKQEHLANYILANGEYDPKFGGEWPLRKEERDILDRNHCALVKSLYLPDLLDQLFSVSVINKQHFEYILSKPTKFEKNRAFLDILYRRSLADYLMTIWCLRETHQDHIADILEKGSSVRDIIPRDQ